MILRKVLNSFCRSPDGIISKGKFEAFWLHLCSRWQSQSSGAKAVIIQCNETWRRNRPITANSLLLVREVKPKMWVANPLISLEFCTQRWVKCVQAVTHWSVDCRGAQEESIDDGTQTRPEPVVNAVCSHLHKLCSVEVMRQNWQVRARWRNLESGYMFSYEKIYNHKS